jgi:hypothetical protein
VKSERQQVVAALAVRSAEEHGKLLGRKVLLNLALRGLSLAWFRQIHSYRIHMLLAEVDCRFAKPTTT